MAGAADRGKWPAEGARPPAWDAAGAESAGGSCGPRRLRAFLAQPSAGAGAARPRSSARSRSPTAAPGMQRRPSGGRPTFSPRLQSLLARLLRPSPARPTERTAPFTSHCSVLLFSLVFCRFVSLRSEK